MSILEDVRNQAFESAMAVTEAAGSKPPPKAVPKLVASPALEGYRQSIVAKTKGQRMRTQGFYLCDKCDAIILKPENGFIVHGNIYVADLKFRGGLIGNNFPNVTPGDKIEVTDVKETVYCKKCFLLALGVIREEASGGKPMALGKPKAVSGPLDNEDFFQELKKLL